MVFLAKNCECIQNDSKSFYAKVRDKVEPLENSDGSIIYDGFHVAEVLNEYFSSVFTKEDISSLPSPARKFEGDESNNLRKLFVIPEMMSTKMKMMNENKSPGVDGIPQKLLKEIVYKISIPLANFVN